MYVVNGSTLRYDQVVAFVSGMDIGSQHALLDGFREFLVLKLDSGNNLAWWALVRHLTVPDCPHPLAPAEEQVAVEGLFDLLDEFLAESGSPGGVATILREHQLWLRRQSWFDPDRFTGPDESDQQRG